MLTILVSCLCVSSALSCARTSKKEDGLRKEVEKYVTGKNHPATADEAYLMVALFIATRLARYIIKFIRLVSSINKCNFWINDQGV